MSQVLKLSSRKKTDGAAILTSAADVAVEDNFKAEGNAEGDMPILLDHLTAAVIEWNEPAAYEMRVEFGKEPTSSTA